MDSRQGMEKQLDIVWNHIYPVMGEIILKKYKVFAQMILLDENKNIDKESWGYLPDNYTISELTICENKTTGLFETNTNQTAQLLNGFA
jgi:hypothetical protein